MPATRTPDRIDARPRPDGAGPLDLDHLRRQCLEDEDLMRELLSLFRVEAPALAMRLAAEDCLSPSAGADIAHRLRGAALAVGAFAVARAADIVAARGRAADSTVVEMSQAVANLGEAISEAVSAIDRLNP